MTGLIRAIAVFSLSVDLIIVFACMAYVLGCKGEAKLKKIDFTLAIVLLLNVLVIMGLAR